MKQVADNLAGAYQVDGVAGGVAGQHLGIDQVVEYLPVPGEGLHTLAVGRQHLLPAFVVFAGGHLRLREVDVGIGEDDASGCVEQPAEVVEVEVCEADGIDVLRLDADALHALQQLATGLRTYAGVEEDGVVHGVFVVGSATGDVDVERRTEGRLAGSQQRVKQGVVMRATEELHGLLALAVLYANDLHTVVLAAYRNAVPFLCRLHTVVILCGFVPSAASGKTHCGNGHHGHHLHSCFHRYTFYFTDSYDSYVYIAVSLSHTNSSPAPASSPPRPPRAGCLSNGRGSYCRACRRRRSVP